jgi:uncharacterized protein YndB with AHSA1/START domain
MSGSDDDRVVVECDLDAPLDKVWRALTDPALVETWLAPGEAGVELGEACDVEPGRRLSYGWRDAATGDAAAQDSIVTFTLTEVEDGVRLRIVHAPVAAAMVMAIGSPRRRLRPRAARMIARRRPTAGLRRAA